MQHQNVKLNRVDHSLPIYSPRTSYDIIKQNDENLLSDLALNFDPFTINVLKLEFSRRNWEMNLIEFIQVVKKNLLNWQMDISNRDQKLVRCLILLFQEIDLNGNGKLEWDEFTNFIIEKATVLNSIKTKKDEIKSYSQSTTKINHKFTNPVAKSIYIDSIDRVAFFEEASNEIFLLNADTGIIEEKSLKIIPKQMAEEEDKSRFTGGGQTNKKVRKTMILDIYYIKDKKYNTLLTSTSDGFVKGWRYTPNGFVLATQPDSEDEYLEHYFKNNIYCMEFDSESDVLYCGQKDGYINIWCLKTDTKVGFEDDRKDQLDDKNGKTSIHQSLESKGSKNQKKVLGHKSEIMSMIAMPKLQFLATAGLDKYWVLWDTVLRKLKRKNKQHTRGILSLAFNERLILLFSAGFNHEFYVWNPYIDKYIYKLVGHASPLIGVSVINNTTQLVSLDSDGYVKVWDIKKFNCVQTFSVEHGEEKDEKKKFNFNSQHLNYIPHPLKLIVSGRNIQVYDYDKGYNPNFVDDYVAICCKFVPYNLTFLTPHGYKIKVWNALTGDIIRIYQDITDAEITCFNLDYYKKRMLIGDSAGNTYVYNILNGAILKKLSKHNGEICQMIDVQQKQLLISVGLDFQIKILDDKKLNESNLIRSINLPDTLFTRIDYDINTRLLVAGTNGGTVCIWEVDSSNSSGNFTQVRIEDEEEVTSVIHIYDCPYMWVANSRGQVSLLSLPPLLFKFQQQLVFSNQDLEKENKVGIIQMHYEPQQQRLYLVDDKGFLKCIGVEQVIAKLLKLSKLKQAPKDNQARMVSTQPDLAGVEYQLLWSVKAHHDLIKSLELVAQENMLITTAYDKKVKLWDLRDGSYLDSFQQNYDKKDPNPIAFKRINTDEFYDFSFVHRVDQMFTMTQKLLGQLDHQDSSQQQTASGEDLPMVLDNNLMEGLKDIQAQNKQKKQLRHLKRQREKDNDQHEHKVVEQKNIMNYIKTPSEEFDPIYDFEKIDIEELQKLGGKNAQYSNTWKLQLQYLKHYQEFEKLYQDTVKKVQLMENSLLQQANNVQSQALFQKPHEDQQQQQQQQQENEGEKEQKFAENDIDDVRVQATNQQDFNKQAYNPGTKSEINLNINAKHGSSLIDQEMAKKKNRQISHTNLHKKQLKARLIDKHTKQIQLSKQEVEASHKLAAALSNIDSSDYRVLKFYDIQEKELKLPRIQPSRHNYVLSNIKKIDQMWDEIKNFQPSHLKRKAPRDNN